MARPARKMLRLCRAGSTTRARRSRNCQRIKRRPMLASVSAAAGSTSHQLKASAWRQISGRLACIIQAAEHAPPAAITSKAVGGQGAQRTPAGSPASTIDLGQIVGIDQIQVTRLEQVE